VDAVHVLPRKGIDLAVGAILALGAAVVLAPAFVAAGSEFDEGILVSFPSLILRGEVPYRDFESFYGPGGAYVVAGFFDVFGTTLGAERAAGFLLRLLLVVAIYWALLAWRRVVAVAGGVIATIVLAAGGVTLDSYPASLAFGVLAIAVASHLVDRRGAGFFVAGMLAGIAGLFRLEAAAETVVALIPFALAWRPRRMLLAVLGLVVGLAPYAPLLIAAGYGKIERNYDDLVATGHARRLPYSLTYSTGRLAEGFALALCLVAVAALAACLARLPEARLTVALALLAALQVPFALWRFDAGHVGNAAVIAFATVPASAAVLLAAAPARWLPGFRARFGFLIPPLAAVVVVLCLLGIGYTRDGLVSNARLAFGNLHSTLVSYKGRDFRVADPVAGRELQQAIALAGRLAPNGGTLFVGPSDLRRMNMNDAFVYYMLPKLRPASFYVEADPPEVKPGAGLAQDVARSTVLILGKRWNADYEPNGTERYGSNASNEVVRRLFCRRGVFGGYEVLTRCS
jgi:hypothetical protein